jgi:hypothetical protein
MFDECRQLIDLYTITESDTEILRIAKELQIKAIDNEKVKDK